MRSAGLYVTIIMVVFLVPLIIAAPPTPHNVRGRVFNIDGESGVENGIPVSLNDTNTSDYVLTKVYAPPLPQFKGSYAATINASDGDTLIVMAWNDSYYGVNTTTIVSGTTYANVVLNIIRPSELKVKIIQPLNNSIEPIGTSFSTIVNVTNIGGLTGTNCQVTISFSNSDVLYLTYGQGDATHNLGTIPAGSSNITSWNVSVNNTGSSNITVEGVCQSDNITFDKLNIDTVVNITSKDTVAPVIMLEYPGNNSKLTTPALLNVTFRYNVSDSSGIINCSLIINNTINQTDFDIKTGISQNFTQELPIGEYSWGINCTDNSTYYNEGSSLRYRLSIISNLPPTVSNLVCDNPVGLSIGTTRIVVCNGTVSDDNGNDDIKLVNATLYHSTVTSESQDDNNNHYTNSSCEMVSESASSRIYSCSFLVWYYADSGSWVFNMTATDNSSETGHGTTTTTVEELLAFNISHNVIDYGDLKPNNISHPAINLTLINLGNVDINVTVEGYGTTPGDGFSMICEQGNIDVSNERYSVTNETLFDDMFKLTSSEKSIGNFTLYQRSNDNDFGNSKNSTYWKIQIEGGTSGRCNGTIIFRARII
ncbi:MAG: hypothetical protein DRP11_01680 [Candidatus Aenigmatarchaeota archaeon]|nr:MAG: hypothetical protein DRP11_01680 [Candidatus Aenigmarchaeota archaeon]